MATGGGPSPSSVEDRRQSLTCSLCLDIFTQPKVLPCLHTFCLKCLEDLTSRQSSSTFPCPHCRSKATIPAGGVSAFPTNLQVRLKDLDKYKSQGTHCPTHHEDQDMFCTECQLSVCLKCIQSEHRQHNIQDLWDAARAAREQLSDYKDRIMRMLNVNMTQALDLEAKQQSLQDKKAAVKSIIQNKCATVVALAEKCWDEWLALVDTLCVQIKDNEVNTTFRTITDQVHDLYHREQRLEQALTTGTECSLVTLAKEMREGTGSAQAVENIMSAKSPTTYPVLNSSHTPDKFTGNVQDFFGVVDTVEMQLTPAEVAVKTFMCKTEPDTEVFCLCPLDDGTLWVSYASCGLQNNTHSDKFEESGQHKSTENEASGKSSWKSRGRGKNIYLATSDSKVRTYSKYRGHYNYHLKLTNILQGKANIWRETVTSEDPFKTESVPEFTINAGPHKAFDVDSSEQFFAVVEEPQVSGGQRKVRLYQRNQPDAITTYTPPSKPFNPADVCFFTLGGKEVLTIADEVGDSVHVVHVQAGGLTFMRHLALGCPLLVQPTALNTDHRGRLWVACRGGAILIMTPTGPSFPFTTLLETP